MVRLSDAISDMKRVQEANGGSLSLPQLKNAIRELYGLSERTISTYMHAFRESGRMKEQGGKFRFV